MSSFLRTDAPCPAVSLEDSAAVSPREWCGKGLGKVSAVCV